MKLPGFHIYWTGFHRTPTVHRQASNADQPPVSTGTTLSGTRTAEINHDQNARRGRFDRMKFFMVTREKYRPAAPAAPAASAAPPTLPALPRFSPSMDISAFGLPDSSAPQFEPTSPRQLPTRRIGRNAQGNPLPPLLRMPVELRQKIVDQLPEGDIKRFRRVSRHTALLAENAIQHLNVDDPKSLKKALTRFQAGLSIKSLTLSGPFSDEYFYNKELQRLMHTALGNLEVFDVYGCDYLTPAGIRLAIQYMPKLKELKLPSQMVVETIINHFAGTVPYDHLRPFRHLKKLDLVGPNPLGNNQIIPLLTILSGLTHLNIAHLDQLTDGALLTALQNKPNLTHLHVRDCPQLTSAGLGTALSAAPSLRHLKLSALPQFDADDNEAPMQQVDGGAPNNDEAIIRVLAHSPQLTHLDLQDCFQFSAQGLATALQHVGNTLISIDLSFANQLAGQALANVLEQVPNLEELKLSGIDELTDDDLTAALQAVPLLKHLEVQDLEGLTDDGLSAALQPLEQLTYLDASSCIGLRHISLPPLDFLETLRIAEVSELQMIRLDNLPALKNLNMEGNAYMNKVEMMSWSLPLVRNTLVTLNMSGMDLRDDEMPYLSDFVQLRRLDLSHNRQLTDAALLTLPTLDQLNVIGCNDLTDAALARVEANDICQYQLSKPTIAIPRP